MESCSCLRRCVARLDTYSLIDLLGSGQFSCVYTATQDSDSTLYAAKYMKLEYNDNKQNALKVMLLLKEVDIYKAVADNPNFLRMRNYSRKGDLVWSSKDSKMSDGPGTEPVIYMILDLATQGSLYDDIRLTGSLPSEVGRHYFHKLVEAVECLHQKGYVHRDIKTTNLLLDGELNLKLADFGYATVVGPTGMFRGFVGTTNYVAPEVCMDKPYSGVKADIYSMGVVLFYMLAGTIPFSSGPEYVCFLKKDGMYWNNAFKTKGLLPETFTPEARNLIDRMLSMEAERPSMEQIRSHPWYNQTIATAEGLRTFFRKRREQITSSYERMLMEVPAEANCTHVSSGEFGSQVGEILEYVSRSAAQPTKGPDDSKLPIFNVCG